MTLLASLRHCKPTTDADCWQAKRLGVAGRNRELTGKPPPASCESCPKNAAPSVSTFSGYQNVSQFLRESMSGSSGMAGAFTGFFLARLVCLAPVHRQEN